MGRASHPSPAASLTGHSRARQALLGFAGIATLMAKETAFWWAERISKYPTTKCRREDGEINLLIDSTDCILYFIGIHVLFWVSLGKWGKTPSSFNGMEELYKVGL